ncbi:MAG: type II secretion system protein GspK, partial [Pelagibacterales bacterium]
AIRLIGWNIFDDNFCTHPESKDFSININSLDIKHAYLFSSLFLDLTLSDSEYIIANLPEEGVKNFGELSKLFPSYELDVQNGAIKFSTNSFNLITRIEFEDYNSESISRIYYDNNNSYIFSRIYNGI